MDEFSPGRDEQNCPICGWMWSEDDMTALKYAELSETEKDAYDEQLINLIKSSPDFDQFEYNCSPHDGMFWSGFRPEKWREFELKKSDTPIWEIDEVIAERKKQQFKPFPPIDTVRAREVALHSELEHWKIENGYYTDHVVEPVNIPKCPTCQSTNIEKISLTRKAVGGALFGLFSSNVRKTMHCKNCGYKW